MINTMIFTLKVYGTDNIADLEALNGIICWKIEECDENDHEAIIKHIDLFEEMHPDFRWNHCDLCRT